MIKLDSRKIIWEAFQSLLEKPAFLKMYVGPKDTGKSFNGWKALLIWMLVFPYESPIIMRKDIADHESTTLTDIENVIGWFDRTFGTNIADSIEIIRHPRPKVVFAQTGQTITFMGFNKRVMSKLAGYKPPHGTITSKIIYEEPMEKVDMLNSEGDDFMGDIMMLASSAFDRHDKNNYKLVQAMKEHKVNNEIWIFSNNWVKSHVINEKYYDVYLPFDEYEMLTQGYQEYYDPNFKFNKGKGLYLMRPGVLCNQDKTDEEIEKLLASKDTDPYFDITVLGKAGNLPGTLFADTFQNVDIGIPSEYNDNENDFINDLIPLTISIDLGQRDAVHATFLATSRTNMYNRVFVIDEYYYKASKAEKLKPREQIMFEIIDKIAKWYDILGATKLNSERSWPVYIDNTKEMNIHDFTAALEEYRSQTGMNFNWLTLGIVDPMKLKKDFRIVNRIQFVYELILNKRLALVEAPILEKFLPLYQLKKDGSGLIDKNLDPWDSLTYALMPYWETMEYTWREKEK